MKEIRVYVVDVDLYDGDTCLDYLTDYEFMEVAEEKGSVYSLRGFQYDYNQDNISSIHTIIRFIEVECSESINFEQWNIPTIKLND